MLSLSLCRLAAAASLLAAIWPAAQAQTPNMPVVRQYGDFAVTNGRYDSLVTLSFRRHGYWPGGAREVVEVRPIKATREGQPMLLAFTKGYTGQGTILIGVQNGEPLMRPISPLQRDNMVRTERDPEWGVPQPGRPEVLLFPRDGRALDTGTGELLWFDVPGNVSGDYPQSMLVSVSPDGRRGAYLTNALTKVGIIVATRDDGRCCCFPATVARSIRARANCCGLTCRTPSLAITRPPCWSPFHPTGGAAPISPGN